MADQIVGWTAGKATNNPNDQWLIKSANRVMGPFKLSEVIMGLELKHFTVMDEIAAPFGRWILVRDEHALQAAVKDIRNRAESVENTATLHTMTTSKSLSSADLLGFDPQERVANGDQSKTNKDAKLAGKASNSSNGILLTVVMVLVLSIFGFIYFQAKKKSRDPFIEGFNQAMQLKNQGFHERAFAVLSKLKTNDKENPTFDLEYSTYQISLQRNQNSVGRKTIERLLNQKQIETPDALAAANTAIALSYLVDGAENDLKYAKESINKALAVNGSFTQALIDRAVINFKRGAFADAQDEFGSLANQTNDGFVLMGSTLASIEVIRKNLGQATPFQVLLNSLDDYLKGNFEYQQEIYILKAYILGVDNKKDKQREAIDQLLNSDLESGQGHRYDILVDRSMVDWKNLLSYCQMAVDVAPKEVLYRALLAYCYSKAERDLEAKDLIKSVETEAPKDPHVAAIKAYILKSLAQDSEAKAYLGIAMGKKEIQSAWLMKAKSCESEKDDACVLDSLEQLLAINPRSLPAYAGMARMEIRRGNKKAALEWIARGQALSSTYMPFLDAKNSL